MKDSPLKTRSAPQMPASSSSEPSPFCNVSTAVSGPSSGGISVASCALAVVFSVTITRSTGPMSAVLA